MVDGLDLDERDVAEIMCGVGQATQYLRSAFPTARCHGYDISRSACEEYARITGRPATACDIVAEPLPENRFDVIVVGGGLHHVAADLDKIVTNLHAALKPGGVFVMMEPNADYFLGSRAHTGTAEIVSSMRIRSKRSAIAGYDRPMLGYLTRRASAISEVRAILSS
jgi:SAM-dependent methyltransferase